MAASKWVINRIGLIDFWYYDEEEFYFRDGRLLLRGANGSGKSVTMQSFIPLLLDGNKAAERLDPFGTKARKLENYLLEENDGREERTGYLYMEFKRRESDTYVTIGIGLSAKKNKKLDAWHFIIRDGRRVGRDFFLYKDLKNKITLSRIELSNRLGEGGQVVDGQNDYMKLVNDTLFGYENVEEYKELVDLLIQLRTPKLSKDFKPTVLNEILSSSLPPLSDEDLRPMSEAIENMDNLKTRLRELESSKKAADKINEVYQQYNRAVLMEKAEGYLNVVQEHRRNEEAYTQTTVRIQEHERLYRQEVQREEALNIELVAMQQKKEALDKSDISKLMEQKLEAEQKLASGISDYAGKEKSLTEKTEKEVKLNYSLQELSAKSGKQQADVLAKLRDMEEGLAVLTFDEHAFMAAELKENLEKAYSFQMLREQMAGMRKEIENGIAILERKLRLEEKQEEEQVKLEKIRQQKQKGLLIEQSQHEQCRQVKSEWEEHFYRWLKQNTLLKLDDEQERYFIHRMQAYDHRTDTVEAKEMLRRQKDAVLSGLQRTGVALDHELKQAQADFDQKQQALEEWQNKQEPEPEKAESILANRAWLRENDIPYYPFYKMVDFAETLDSEQRNRLEEALHCMGILDAIIVPDNYRETVLASRTGMRDTYIFGNAGVVAASLGKLLAVTAEIDDLILYQEIAKVLNGMATAADGKTWVDSEGRFGLGLLNGTITGSYQAKFIGVRAREQYRRARILELERVLATCRELVNAVLLRIEENNGLIAGLEAEYTAYPAEAEVIAAVRELAETQESIRKLQKEMEERGLTLSLLQKDLLAVGLEASQNSKKLYLKSDPAIYQEARSEAAAYYDAIGSLEIGHHSYLHQLENARALQDRMEELQAMLDEIRYDLNKQNRELAQLRSTIAVYEEQLSTKDYETVRAQLTACVQRIKAIPEELRQCHLQQSASQKDQEACAEKLQTLAQQAEKCRCDVLLHEKGLEDEKNLAYVVEADKVIDEDIAAWAKNIGLLLQADCLKSASELSSQLQQKFYENLSELVDFNLTINPLFGKEDYSEYPVGTTEPNFKRLALFAKYKGKEVPYDTLINGLAGDVDIQKNLVKESDRTLFEDVLANTVSKKIRAKIYKSETWVDKMNRLMSSMNTSSGLRLSLVWKKKKAEEEGQLDTKELVELLKKDAGLMTEQELEQLSVHFQTKVQEARRIMEETGSIRSFHAVMKDVLDYRKWFEFQLFYQKTGENRKELTNNAFFTFSGGEKAMSMYVPLFSAVVAKYDGAREDAPRLVSLDEAFAGVDEQNISDMFRLMVDMEFEFIINSQILWGDCDTVPDLAIYQLLRKENAKFVTVLPYIWNGKARRLVSGDELERE